MEVAHQYIAKRRTFGRPCPPFDDVPAAILESIQPT